MKGKGTSAQWARARVCLWHPGLARLAREAHLCLSLRAAQALGAQWRFAVTLLSPAHHPSGRFHFQTPLSHPRKSLRLKFSNIKWLVRSALPIETQFNAGKDIEAWVSELNPFKWPSYQWWECDWIAIKNLFFSSKETNKHFLKYMYSLSEDSTVVNSFKPY